MGHITFTQVTGEVTDEVAGEVERLRPVLNGEMFRQARPLA
jgi:hypothetical protein